MNFVDLYNLDPERGEAELARLAVPLPLHSPWRQALQLTRYGIGIIPLHGIIGRRGNLHCECRWEGCPAGKAPYAVKVVENGEERRSWKPLVTANLYQAAKYADRLPRSNYAVVTGKDSRLVVIDVDGEAGLETFQAREAELGALPETAVSRSGREGYGRHYWLRLPDGGPVPGNHPRLGNKIDVRGQGGFAVGPGSRHLSGRRYAWIKAPWDVGFAEMPEPWLRRLTTAPAAVPMAPGAGVAAKAATASTGRSDGSTGGMGRDGPPVMGDGEGGEGFHTPIYRWLCRFYRNNPNGDPTAFFDLLRDRIDAAPKENSAARAASIVRYKSEQYLEEQAKRAQAFIQSQN